MSRLTKSLLALLVLGLLALPATAGAAKSGRYKGSLYYFGSYKPIDKTGKVNFRVEDNRIVRFKLEDPSYRCLNNGFDPTDDDFESATVILYKPARIRDGKVHKVYKNDVWKLTLKGTFRRGGRAKGSINFVSYEAGCSKSWYWGARIR